MISRWGVPEVIHTDNGTEFTNIIRTNVSECWYHPHNDPGLPRTSCPTERVNRVLKTMIVSFIHDNHQDWDVHLPEFRFSYNFAVHGTLKVSPAFLNFGRNPLLYRSMRRDLEKGNQHARPQPEEWLQRL